MKKVLLRCILGAVLVALAPLALADGYIGVGYTMIDIDATDYTGYQLSGGYQFNEIFGIEARTLMGSSDDKYNGATLSIDEFYGAYVTLQLPVGETVSPYLILGQTHGKVTAEYQGFTASVSDTDTSYGIGARLSVRENFTVQIEYMRALEDVDALTVTARFNL